MSNKFYNPEIKERFLSTYENDQTKNTIKYVFYNSQPTEELLEKDLFDFNLIEIGKVIKDSNPHSLTTAKATGRFITKYIAWAIDEYLREDNINPLRAIDDSFYEPLIDKTKKTHYSEDEFNDLLERLPNAQDQAFLRLIYEGLMGKAFSELQELHFNDINWHTNEIYIKERDEKMKVTDICMRYLQNAYKQQIYYTFDKDKGEHNERELLQSDYIFKNLKSPRSIVGEPVKPSVFYTRLNNIKEEFDLEYLTPNAVRQSGMIKMAVDLYKEYGKLEYEQFEKIGDRYKTSKIVSGDYEYYNTTLLKEFISPEKIKELYDIDIQF